jgi:hypothetical protein
MRDTPVNYGYPRGTFWRVTMRILAFRHPAGSARPGLVNELKVYDLSALGYTETLAFSPETTQPVV